MQRFQGPLEQDDGLLGRMIRLRVLGAGQAHLGARRSPDRRLVALAKERDLRPSSADDPTALMAPVVPGATHREPLLVPTVVPSPRETRGLSGANRTCRRWRWREGSAVASASP